MGKWYLAEMLADTRVWKRTPPVEPPGCGPLGRQGLRSRVAKTAPPPERVDLGGGSVIDSAKALWAF